MAEKVTKAVQRAREKHYALARAELALLLSDLMIACPIDAPIRRHLAKTRDRIAEEAAMLCVRTFRRG